MRKALVAGNWKMNGSLTSTRELLTTIKQGSSVDNVELAVLPPSIYLAETAALLANTSIAWGAQNLSEHVKGAYTGEIAASMLQDFNCTYVLVGHSERRALYGESDALVAAKFATARAADLRPILCVGESLSEREQGNTHAVVSRQLDAVLALESINAINDCVIAYEPVWAIGTGETATPEQAQDVHAFIRGKIAEQDATIASLVQILYGGSVKSSNAAALFSQPDIDGGLIGGASLDGEEFLRIAQAAH